MSGSGFTRNLHVTISGLGLGVWGFQYRGLPFGALIGNISRFGAPRRNRNQGFGIRAYRVLGLGCWALG